VGAIAPQTGGSGQTLEPSRGDAAGDAAAPAEPSWREGLGYCLRVFVAVRLGLFLLGLLGPSLLVLQPSVDVPGWTAPDPSSGWHQAVVAWERADAAWFLRIASSGYSPDDGSPAFFPLFPMLVHGMGVLVGGRWLLAGFLVANAALLGAMVLLYRLTRMEWSASMARRTVLFMAIFPTSFYLFSPFTEPLFLLCAVGALLAARRGAWWWAALAGAGAAATRSIGIVLVGVLAVEALHQLLQARRDGASWRPGRVAGVAAACVAPTLGTLSYLAYWQLHTGSWRVPFNAQGGWSRTLRWPWDTLRRGIDMGTDNLGIFSGGYWTIDLLFLALAVAAGVWLLRRTRPAYSVYLWASILFPLLFSFDSRPLMSFPRFATMIFPLYWAIAALAERRNADALLVGLSTGGLVLLGVLSISYLPMF
jgi:hypothetical protein